MSRLEDLLAEVPDEPANVDLRGLLLEEPELFGNDSGSVALRADGRLLAAFGRPGRQAVEQALAGARAGAELVAPTEAREWLEEILGAEGERAFLHTLGEQGVKRPSHLPQAVLLTAEAELEHLPDELREEIEGVLAERPVAGVLGGRRPVSFCFPTLLTERYWDVSIETLPSFRHTGCAAASFLRLNEEMRETGREPVWGAAESNTGSLRLAQKLGFEKVGEIAVFELDSQPDLS